MRQYVALPDPNLKEVYRNSAKTMEFFFIHPDTKEISKVTATFFLPDNTTILKSFQTSENIDLDDDMPILFPDLANLRKLGRTGENSRNKTYRECSLYTRGNRRRSTRAEIFLRYECESGKVTLVPKNEDDLRNQIPATAPFPVTPNRNVNTTEISSSSSTPLDKTLKAIEGLTNHASHTQSAIDGLTNHGQAMENRLSSYASHTQSAIEGLTNHGHLLANRLDRLGTIVANQSNSIQRLGNTLESHDRKLNNLEDRVKQLEINGEQGTNINIDKDAAARGSATPANATTNTFFGTGTTASYLETDGTLKNESEEDATTTDMEFEIDSTLQKGQTTLPTAAAASGGATPSHANVAAETPFTTPSKPPAPAPASASIRLAPFASVAKAAPHSNADADAKPPSMAHGAAQNVFGTPQQRVFSEAGGNAKTVAFASTAEVAETSSTTAFKSPAFSTPAPFPSGTQPFFSIAASSKKEQLTFAARSEKRRQTLFASKGSKSREFFRKHKSNRNLSSKHCRRKVSHLRPEEGGVVDHALPVRNLSEAFNPSSTVTVGLPFPFNFMP